MPSGRAYASLPSGAKAKDMPHQPYTPPLFALSILRGLPLFVRLTRYKSLFACQPGAVLRGSTVEYATEFVPGIHAAKWTTFFACSEINLGSRFLVRTAQSVLISSSAGLLDLRVKTKYSPLGESVKIRPSRSPVLTM